MKASKGIIKAVKLMEGLSLTPYDDGLGYMTIGYGHLIIKNGDKHLQAVLPGVTEADIQAALRLKRSPIQLTIEQADKLFELDQKEIEKGINKRYKNLNQGEFDALFSFIFNLGFGRLDKSTLNIKLLQGDKQGAALEFLKWKYGTVKGVPTVLVGLLKRRDFERCVFLSKDEAISPSTTLHRKSIREEIVELLIRYAKERFNEDGSTIKLGA